MIHHLFINEHVDFKILITILYTRKCVQICPNARFLWKTHFESSKKGNKSHGICLLKKVYKSHKIYKILTNS